METLRKIQQELKAPKGQFNKFGGYNYRSAEDILEAVKPLLAKHKAELILSDEIVEVGGRIYVKAVAMLSDGENNQAKVSAFAREPEEKKGMDASQITGTASSYARKYALNGLFLIDDTKDADTDEFRQQTTQQQPKQQPEAEPPKKADAATVKMIRELIAATQSDAKKLLDFFKVGAIEEMTQGQANKCKAMLRSKQQKAMKEHGWTAAEFAEIFGKNYL